MNPDGLTPTGDLPPNHPLVLEALKGIISGPISELRTKVDNLITNPSNTLRKGAIDYNNILPTAQSVHQPVDQNVAIANNILSQIAPVQYANVTAPTQPVQPQVAVVPAAPVATPIQPVVTDPDQFELPLYKKASIEDLYNKMFDIEEKLDRLISYVKGSQNKK